MVEIILMRVEEGEVVGEVAAVVVEVLRTVQQPHPARQMMQQLMKEVYSKQNSKMYAFEMKWMKRWDFLGSAKVLGGRDG